MSKEKQQTAVEWFYEQVNELFGFVDDETANKFISFGKEAKEMEEKQIKVAYSYGVTHLANGIRNVDCNKYYNEKYGK